MVEQERMATHCQLNDISTVHANHLVRAENHPFRNGEQIFPRVCGSLTEKHFTIAGLKGDPYSD